ncbi:hypothetical protein A7A08_00795 [Methyloligella halotolerans]|uniref:Uncharacterized protein n=1 Tax=Methyloligella halotolerans TaxID=1177755 RepID=A0A1E2S3E6_9HYPH|nr:hypothetical protein [Methyloligella halotolerans]ODA68961.1 hypothetical protein A7A08_00795 [Methyloligella halotolerans]
MATMSDDWNWWWGAWRNRIRCGSCRALVDLNDPCPICGADYSKVEPVEVIIDGSPVTVSPALQGALDWSPYVMLKLMHQEWLRPLSEEDWVLPEASQPSPRLVIVLVFWTYFEALMDRYFEAVTSELPRAVATDLLARYSGIGVRLDRLHRVFFNARYGEDLDRLGFTAIRVHLELLQKRRNAFVHGDPAAISDELVEDTVRLLPQFHEAWFKRLTSAAPSALNSSQSPSKRRV